MPAMLRTRLLSLLSIVAITSLFAPAGASAAGFMPGALSVAPVDREPKARALPSDAEFAAMRQAIVDAPKLRKPRFDLVHTLVRAGQLEPARKEATEWRLHDAYSLVAVRQLGDIETALGYAKSARRTYSAIVELLPKDVEARRALATIFKQTGDFENARTQLLAALELRPEDRRTTFELGDVEEHLGHHAEATAHFETIRTATDVSESIRYPAEQRLSQILGAERREATASGDATRAAALGKRIEALKIHGGSENDIKIFLSWDTDRTDIDLWVTTPRGEKIYYQHRSGKHGEALFDDVTTGYGPESFTAAKAESGDYLVSVNFFGAQGAFKEARGEVSVILDEGRPGELRQVFPYRIFDEKDTVTVAKIHVQGPR
jgi:tetratricopeptide (TPR) repeat protein